MKVGDANAMRLCLCCGREGAGLYRLRDGRAVRVCRQCAWSCDGCQAWLNGARERKPIGREAEYQEVKS